MFITLKDGLSKEYNERMTAYEIALDISEGLARAALACRIDGELCDLNTVVCKDCRLEIVTFKDEDGKSVFPTVKLAIGPSIQNGFYYDFDFKTPITFDDLKRIEDEMKKIVKADYPIRRFTLAKEAAVDLMRGFDETYKIELIEALPYDATISFYEQGDFIDLCAGPHLRSTGQIKCFKLTQLTGAYWRGDEKNKMLSRIYGTAFDKKSDLQEYLEKMEEAKRRDHNKLGRELGIFMTDENVGQGLPLLMPKGARIIQTLQRFVEDEEEKRGYLLTKTPLMAKSNLYKISGHWDHYKDGMFVMGDEEKDEEVFALRPMTCPFQYTVYNNGLKSYRDLPLRYGETSTLFRNESSGEMHGLIRVRQFTISEGHIVCTPEQLEDEFKEVLKLNMFMLESVGLKEDVSFRLSKWDPDNREKYIDDEKTWAAAESKMKSILDSLGIDYVEAVGEAAFYGPKLDIQIRNVYGKEDTLVTVQVDMFLAERFNMTYIDETGDKKRPYIIHRTAIGCYERTLALLIEKYAGAMPLWLSPCQVKVIGITDRTHGAVKNIADMLRDNGIKAEVDTRSETIGYKIRSAQMEKVPYMIILGDKELESGKISVRHRKDGDLGEMNIDEFIKRVSEEIKTRRLDK